MNLERKYTIVCENIRRHSVLLKPCKSAKNSTPVSSTNVLRSATNQRASVTRWNRRHVNEHDRVVQLNFLGVFQPSENCGKMSLGNENGFLCYNIRRHSARKNCFKFANKHLVTYRVTLNERRGINVEIVR